jgi:hypothetical protein
MEGPPRRSTDYLKRSLSYFVVPGILFEIPVKREFCSPLGIKDYARKSSRQDKTQSDGIAITFSIE